MRTLEDTKALRAGTAAEDSFAPPGALQHDARGPAKDGAAAINHIDVLEKNLARQVEAVRASDTKIALLIPAETVMLGVIVAMFRTADPGPTTSFYVALSTLPLILSYASAALCAFPRIRSSANSLLFFGGIAARSPEEYLAGVRRLDREAYMADLAEQCSTVARIAAAKSRHARNAYLAFYAALPFWAVTVYLLSRVP